MPHDSSLTDFTVDVPGIGQFVFARRGVRDAFRIRGAYAQITGSHYTVDGRMADISALGFATIITLMVEGPKGFNIEALDPLEDEDFDKTIMKIFAALRDKEVSFSSKNAVKTPAVDKPDADKSDDAPGA
jgi:hypothetical protein